MSSKDLRWGVTLPVVLIDGGLDQASIEKDAELSEILPESQKQSDFGADRMIFLK